MEVAGAVASIILFDLLLSGDNAIVIGMAAHSLPARQRKWAIIIGGALAVLLRVVNTAIATILLQIPALMAAGGLLLLWVAFRLLKHEEEGQGQVKVAATFRDALLTITVADFIMSLDNVLTVAAAAHGTVWLLMFGLFLSMPIVLFCGSMVASLIDRFWWLAYVGAAVITWTGAGMIMEDQYVSAIIGDLGIWETVISAAATIAVVGFAHWYHRQRRMAGKIEQMATEIPVEVKER